MVWLIRLAKMSLLATSVTALLWVALHMLVLAAAFVMAVLAIMFLSGEADAVLGL